MAALFLDCDATAAEAGDPACEICERGMRFCTTRQFVQGAMLEIVFECGEWAKRLRAEGVVVDCAREPSGRWVTTLLFLEISRELRASLGMVFSKLSFE